MNETYSIRGQLKDHEDLDLTAHLEDGTLAAFVANGDQDDTTALKNILQDASKETSKQINEMNKNIIEKSRETWSVIFLI